MPDERKSINSKSINEDNTNNCINVSCEFWERINKEIKEYIGQRISEQYSIDYDNIKSWTIKKPL